jgi:hypothetical protein
MEFLGFLLAPIQKIESCIIKKKALNSPRAHRKRQQLPSDGSIEIVPDNFGDLLSFFCGGGHLR